MATTNLSPGTQLSLQELARSLVSPILDEHLLPSRRIRLKTPTYLVSQTLSFFSKKQGQGIPITDSLIHNARVLVVNSLVMRRLGRFKDKQAAKEGERWVKMEWENMEKPVPQIDQQQSARMVPSGLKRGLDGVDGLEDKFHPKRVKPSLGSSSISSSVNQNGSEKLLIDLTQDGDEDLSGKQVEAPYFQPGVAPAAQGANTTIQEAVVDGLPLPIRGLKRTFGDRAVEIPKETKRLKVEEYAEE